jgi:sigma-B regulation protein RsbU (phosphoserine phosphatase)
MFYGALQDGGRLRYSNAGQEPPVVVHAGGRLGALDAGGPVLGLLNQASYDSGEVQLAAGDLVVVCSDGVTEARSASGDEFGRERMEDTLKACHGMSPDAVIDTLMGAIRVFVGSAPQADDITVLVVRYGGRR